MHFLMFLPEILSCLCFSENFSGPSHAHFSEPGRPGADKCHELFRNIHVNLLVSIEFQSSHISPLGEKKVWHNSLPPGTFRCHTLRGSHKVPRTVAGLTKISRLQKIISRLHRNPLLEGKAITQPFLVQLD